MSDQIIYYVEAQLPSEKRIGIFREKHTAECWISQLGEDVQPRITPVHMADSRHNHNLTTYLDPAPYRA